MRSISCRLCGKRLGPDVDRFAVRRYDRGYELSAGGHGLSYCWFCGQCWSYLEKAVGKLRRILEVANG